ncbi:MAG: thiamine pyrophosphate-binding protein [Cyanobacteria bacterium]|nr:thiamine pyrophosphate-binding protein [Cyanobacteriota bacterium]
MSKQEILTGAELISRAAMDSGVDFFAGYPITPASSIYSSMLSKLQAQGKLAIGTSDEISAICMCIGASMRGAKAMTASSAPGISLMVENIGYAFATETPLLIVHGQRLGPSTGAATQSAEGDISFVQHLISGGYEIPVFAPSSILNCYETTINAINCSEKYRCPVILLTEKDIIMSSTNISVNTLDEIKAKSIIVNRKQRSPDNDQSFKTYDFNRLEEVPEFLATGLGLEDRVVATASTHDKAGRLLKNSAEVFEVIEHLAAKIQTNKKHFSSYKLDKESGATVAIISFLASDLSAREAVIQLQKDGHKINHLTLFSLFPVADFAIKEAIKGCSKVVIPEVNMQGQYAEIIRPLLEGKELIKVNSLADLIEPERIIEGCK